MAFKRHFVSYSTISFSTNEIFDCEDLPPEFSAKFGMDLGYDTSENESVILTEGAYGWFSIVGKSVTILNRSL